MSLTGKLVTEVEVKSSGDLFHELFKSSPHQVPNISPHNIQGCDLHDGDWGTVGSVLIWNYTVGGKKQVAKELVEAIDERAKLVRFKVIEGDLLKLYKNFAVSAHVETKGETDVVIWTMEYEKLNPNVPDPHELIEFVRHLTKDIEAHHLQ